MCRDRLDGPRARAQLEAVEAVEAVAAAPAGVPDGACGEKGRGLVGPGEQLDLPEVDWDEVFGVIEDAHAYVSDR